ncbi:MAG: hypothetical protein ACETWB_02720 [Anaerolineae bacterium]
MRIGLIIIGHRDYPNEVGARMAALAAESLRGGGVEVVMQARACVEPWEAGEAARNLAAEGVDGVIIFLGTWIEAPVAVAAIREVEHLPLLLWGFPMYEEDGRRESTGSSVAYAVVKAALDRAGRPYKGLLGAVDDEGALQQALSFCRAAHAAGRLKRTRLGLVGYASMGMYSATFDHVLLRFLIGPEVEQADSYSIFRRAESFERKECLAVIERLRQMAFIAPEVNEEELLTAARLYLALKSWAEERRLDAVCVKCQYEFSQEYGMVACVPLSLLAEDGVVTACEGDVLLTVSMAILHYLTEQAIYYGDALDYVRNKVYLSSCGFVPYSLADPADEAFIRPTAHPGFKGILNSFPLKPGRVTFLRLAEGRGDYFFTYGTGAGLPSTRRQGWAPAIDVQLDGDVNVFIEKLTTQHYPLAYGDLSAEIEDLAWIVGIPACRI